MTFSIPILIVLLLMIGVNSYGICLAVIVASSTWLSSNEEGKALHRCHGWGGHNISNHCNWGGIVCNHAGSITNISTPKNISLSELFLSDFNATVLPNLVHLDLSEMGLIGSIPTEMGALNKLTYLNLSRNNLTGELPSTIANLIKLVMLDLSSNSISGEIPHEFINLKKLVLLNLSRNSFNGSIPSEIGYSSSLKFLDLSNNNLHGNIPSGLLNHCHYLKLYINFSNGSIPSSRISNIPYLDLSYNNHTSKIPENTTSYMLRVLNAFILGAFVACSVFYVIMFLFAAEDLKNAERRIKYEERRGKNEDSFSIWNYDGKVTYEDIIEATNDFDIKYCIGTGA
ncbi:hypothetical protein L6164_013162 [Bauhinia variegata]|uniref:Uncharacterized protein n=1 Tax=Bauhinia variegata TaxID=167791 RepID=A0ACB9PC71_BAUVA|nr:hypothetical protein L6164_013162 [Bauhinia variegata]